MNPKIVEILAALPVLLRLIPGFRDFLSALTSDTEGKLRPQVDEILKNDALEKLDSELLRIEKSL